MKGKATFTDSESARIKRLIVEKVRATPAKQKSLRQKIRNLGFYYSDFSADKEGYTVADFEALVASGRIRIIPDASKNAAPQHYLKVPVAKAPLVVSRTRRDRDEHYVLDLCDRVLRLEASRQHTFDFLLGDKNARGVGRKLPVDGYYAPLQLVIEYREHQHTESVRFFDKPEQMTLSGVHRGEQRRIYDERRTQVLREQGIVLVEISYLEFSHDKQKRIKRDPATDERVIREKLRSFSRKR